ncbi:Uncharacterized protein APZ42_018118 [Daphnia magna]|uniref:Uncharacterized protein n=1 Tax=Daphnia magna TaxID=35525 RepID=A0A164ZBX0_9CRUS|nr:Uncharacterized protein APZ42_018118 [Daphnia magna]
MMIMWIMMMNTTKSCEKSPWQWPLIIEAGRLQVQQPKTRICKQLSLSAYKKTKKKRERRRWCSAFFCVCGSCCSSVPVLLALRESHTHTLTHTKVTIPAQQVVKVVGNQTSTGSHARVFFSCCCQCGCAYFLPYSHFFVSFLHIFITLFLISSSATAAALCV